MLELLHRSSGCGSAFAALLLVSGCQSYRSEPLPAASDLSAAPALTLPATCFQLPGLPPHPVDMTDGLDVTTAMTLAVADDPDLVAARAQAGVADAQVLEAGLLPDPKLSGGMSRSTMFTGYDAALSENLHALVTRGAAKAAAQAARGQVNLQILWQEWQVAERAGELFIQHGMDARLEALLKPDRDLLERQARAESRAFQREDATAAAAALAAKMLADADENLRQIELDRNHADHELKALLGLRPDARLKLRETRETPVPLSEEQFGRALANLPARRPDLRALQAGYESQQQRLREAVLAQFPAIDAGLEKARDADEGVSSVGFTVNVTLPLFNRNRGQIAIERTTRAALRKAYSARLDQAVS
ncbi:MAG: TolC family protein, partial [Opitutaceae bacterium]